MEGDALRTVCRAALVDAERPADEHGDPVELDELDALVDAVRASPVWIRAAAAEHRLAEVPFALRLTAGEARALGVLVDDGAGEGASDGEPEGAGAPEPASGADGGGAEGCAVLVEGVVDLAFRDSGAWTIVDYKTGVSDAAEADDARIERYRRQVDLYAACWQRITGEPVVGRVVVLAGAGREVAW
jgi:ATP-dependent exoDNAse (exonuclease V) beta subunit